MPQRWTTFFAAAVSSDNPMTYMHEGRQFIVVAMGGASTAPRTL